MSCPPRHARTDAGPPVHEPRPAHAAVGIDVSLQLDLLYTEKLPDRGEDAPPVTVGPTAVGAERVGCVAVCDGLGGAGSTPVATPHGPMTSARVAAKAVADGIEDWFRRDVRPEPPAGRELEQHLRDVLARLARQYDGAGGGSGLLRSRLIRPFPTTVALAWVSVGAAGIRVSSFWAGDSRVYVVRATTGLQQLTRDDLRSAGDALENLEQDSPMSNLLSADGDFALHEHHLAFGPEPIVVVAATDGCFGYVPSPLHFELLLLDAIESCHDLPGVMDSLRRRFQDIAGDDATLSLAMAGWPGYPQLRRAFAARTAAVRDMVRRHDALRADVHRLRAELVRAEGAVEAARREMWARYRPGYEDEMAPRAVPDDPPRGTPAAPLPGPVSTIAPAEPAGGAARPPEPSPAGPPPAPAGTPALPLGTVGTSAVPVDAPGPPSPAAVTREDRPAAVAREDGPAGAPDRRASGGSRSDRPDPESAHPLYDWQRDGGIDG